MTPSSLGKHEERPRTNRSTCERRAAHRRDADGHRGAVRAHRDEKGATTSEQFNVDTWLRLGKPGKFAGARAGRVGARPPRFPVAASAAPRPHGGPSGPRAAPRCSPTRLSSADPAQVDLVASSVAPSPPTAASEVSSARPPSEPGAAARPSFSGTAEPGELGRRPPASRAPPPPATPPVLRSPGAEPRSQTPWPRGKVRAG